MSDRLLKESDVIEAFKGRESLIHDVYTATAIIRSIPSADTTSYEKGYADAVQGIADELVRQGKHIEADRPSREWIPCSERLPREEKATYLVCTDSEYMCSCRWTNTNPIWTNLTTEWHWCIFDISQYSKVVAWMPLEPWKGADDEVL